MNDRSYGFEVLFEFFWDMPNFCLNLTFQLAPGIAHQHLAVAATAPAPINPSQPGVKLFEFSKNVFFKRLFYLISEPSESAPRPSGLFRFDLDSPHP